MSVYNQIKMAASTKKEIVDSEQDVRKEKLLVEWTARTRPFKRRSREFYINLFAVSALIGLIIFLIEGLIPVLLIVALLFIFYVFSTIEPESANYKLTTFGIRINDELVKFWEELGLYWFARRMDEEVLIMETNTMPWKVEIVIDQKMKGKIEDVVSKKLYRNEAPETNLDKAIHWLGNKIK